MSATFSVTLVALQPDGQRASLDFGENALGQMAVEELRQLLERFRVVDPIELVTADPEIIIENQRTKFVVRAGEGKLYLRDQSKYDEPTLALSSSEILAELDGSAKAERVRRGAEVAEREAAARAALAETEVVVAPVERSPSVLKPGHRAALAGVGACLLAYMVFALWPAPSIAGATNFELLTEEKEIARVRADVVGVYMAGSRPGDHGIALTADGAIRLFVVNAKAPPSQIRGTFQLGRSDGQLCLRTQQAGSLIRVTGPDTLTFGSELYQRLR